MEWVTTVAVVVTGAATVGLAWITYRSFGENRKLIEATAAGARASEAQALAAQQQAEAATKQVEASTQTVSEMQFDRELAVAPYLTLDFKSAYSNGEPTSVRMLLKNVGQGTALNCLCCAIVTWDPQPIPEGVKRERETRYFRLPEAGPLTLPLHLAAGQPEESQPTAMGNLDNQIGQVMFDMNIGLPLAIAAVCEDQFGNRYRFRSNSATRDLWRRGQDGQPWIHWIPLPNTEA
jgi:hypothetical protein